MTHVFKHPSYYKRIRAANKDQAISTSDSTECSDKRAPDPDPQAASVKHQATPDASDKRQAPSDKRQASSRKRQAP